MSRDDDRHDPRPALAREHLDRVLDEADARGHGDETRGAGFGAAAGAVLGTFIAGPLGAMVGGGLGALLGASVGRDRDRDPR